MKRLVEILIALLLFLQLLVTASAADSYQASVQSIIDSDQAPEGVVFEIVSKDKQYLDWALPETDKLSRQLRDRFPALEIAIVSHGSEQFALTSTQLASNPSLNSTLESLSSSNIEVHVCGTHAERKGVYAEEFSKLVDVAAEGPAQINDYIKLGYVRIRLVKS